MIDMIPYNVAEIRKFGIRKGSNLILIDARYEENSSDNIFDRAFPRAYFFPLFLPFSFHSSERASTIPRTHAFHFCTANREFHRNFPISSTRFHEAFHVISRGTRSKYTIHEHLETFFHSCIYYLNFIKGLTYCAIGSILWILYYHLNIVQIWKNQLIVKEIFILTNHHIITYSFHLKWEKFQTRVWNIFLFILRN